MTASLPKRRRVEEVRLEGGVYAELEHFGGGDWGVRCRLCQWRHYTGPRSGGRIGAKEDAVAHAALHIAREERP